MSIKSVQNREYRRAQRKGQLLRKSRTRNPDAEHFGLYVLIGDSRGNRRLPGAIAPYSAFRRGEGMTLAHITEVLDTLPDMR
jgi:hypothetical protein